MTTKKILSISILSGLAGAVFSALLINSISSSKAAVSTSGYYVCGNKVSGALRMSPSSNKCKSTEFRYFFASTVDQVDSTVLQTSAQNSETFDFLAPRFGRCPGSSVGTTVVTGVGWNSYYLSHPSSIYSPLDVSTQSLQNCRLTVNVP